MKRTLESLSPVLGLRTLRYLMFRKFSGPFLRISVEIYHSVQSYFVFLCIDLLNAVENFSYCFQTDVVDAILGVLS